MSYTINSSNLSAYGLTVLSSEGALDFPKRLPGYEHNWGDSNGVEPYVSSTDLFWDGRTIVLKAFYSGSNFITSIESFIAAFKGSDLTLITTYGSHTVRLSGVKTVKLINNLQAIVDISFWESEVYNIAPPAATGGTGITIGGYDFLKDFGLHVNGASGYGDISDFYERQITYGTTSKKISGQRRNRTVRIELNGKYADLATLITKVNNLRKVLMSSGVKSLVYKGVTKTVYFVDGSRVDADPKKLTAKIILTLKVQE